MTDTGSAGHTVGVKSGNGVHSSTEVMHRQLDIYDLIFSGQKRTSIRERAAVLSTTDKFFRRKLLRSPRKNSVAASPSYGTSADSLSGYDTVPEDRVTAPEDDKIKILKEIMEGMQPSSKENPNKTSKSKKKIRMKTLSEDPQEHADASSTSGHAADEGLQDILLPSESCEHKHNNRPPSREAARSGCPKHKEKISSPEQNVKSRSSGASSSPQKVVQQGKKVGPEKMPVKKTRKSQSQKEAERRSMVSQLRNFRPERTEQTPALENPDTPREENGPENVLRERDVGTPIPEDDAEESTTGPDAAAMNEDPLSRTKDKSLSCRKRRRKPGKNCLRKKIPRVKPPNSDYGEMEMSMIVEEKKNTACKGKKTDKMPIWEQKGMEIEIENHDICSEQYSTQINFYPVTLKMTDIQSKSFTINPSDRSNETAEKIVTAGDAVCEDIQTVVTKGVCEVPSGLAICKTEVVESFLPSEYTCEDVSCQTNSGNLLSDNSNRESILPAVSNNQTISEESLPQEICDSTISPQNVVTVRVAARMYKNDHQKPKECQQVSEVMFFLLINFEVENVLIQSKSLRISKDNLEAIYNDEKKLQKFRKKMYSFLPSKYQSYDMLLEIVIHDVVFDKDETSLLESPEQTVQCSPERDHPERDPLAGDVPEPLNGQAVSANTIGTYWKNINDGAKGVHTEDGSMRVSHEVTNDSSFSDQTKRESISQTGGKTQAVSNSDPQKTWGMDVAENVINVEISARMPRKKPKGECMAILQIEFYLKNVMIHSTKFKMDKKDLAVIHNDKTKLEKMKKRFHSFLPPKYKNYELLLQLTIHNIVF